MKRWDSLVDGYMGVCEARGVSDSSLGSIRDELDRWGCWMKRRRPKPRLDEVGHELLVEYLKRRTPFRAKSTLSSIASKMRCMGEYLVRQGVWQQNPMRWVKGPRLDARGKLPRRIGSGHLSKLWEATTQQRGDYRKHLAIAILALLYGTGLRRGELERLQVKDWDREQNVLAVDGRKTACERSIPLSEPIARCLEAYLPLRQNQLERCNRPEEKRLLINRQGGPLSAQCIGLLIHRLARSAGVPLVTVHQFRHTCASDLLENGASLPEVQRILGHKRVQTTSRYVHIASPERVQAMKKHPLNDYLSDLLAGEKETTRS